jgi:hypothetical protein
MDDAEKAIYADGMRGYLPLLLGMSTRPSGAARPLMSSRTPVFHFLGSASHPTTELESPHRVG